ncbi:MAG TPA: NAD(P)H-dependent glycerol-3-phosphate dehydrogenase, partial [Campylobacterales bacterium]|nr:NAD(P)H-dependent glycerol-3-phosphate dehydrogenase [Campylobacterales bacterium]
MKIGIIGAGKWGQALHFALSQKNRIYIHSRTRRDIENFVSLDEVLDCEYLIIAISTQALRGWLSNNFQYRNQKVLLATKGIDIEIGEFPSQILEKFVPKENIAFLSGPSFADEVVQSLPTALVINSSNLETANQFANLFPKFIKTYISTDIRGAEIAGAYKNILAIASGICEGLKLGNNAKASLIARGLVEMARFGKIFGGEIETFLGLSGAGDLFLTANSTMSRNYRVGLRLSEGKNIDEILEELGEVAEGVKSVEAIIKIKNRENLYTPIADEVYKIIHNLTTPLEALDR